MPKIHNYYQTPYRKQLRADINKLEAGKMTLKNGVINLREMIESSYDLVGIEAKKKGLQVSCSVSAHHLTLIDDELQFFDSKVKVTPPLRTKADTKALQKGLKDGIIDMITSDHNPIDTEHKKLEFSLSKDGTIGLESLFGAVNTVLDLETTIKCLTINPRSVFGQDIQSIKKDTIANFTLFNPEGSYLFSKDNILSTSKNSAFEGKKLKGTVYGIFANKKLVLN